MLSLCNAEGVAILANNKIFLSGNTPPKADVEKLAKIFFETEADTFNSAQLSFSIPSAEDHCDKASGVIFHRIGSGDKSCIIWFRPESIEEVNWAGDPAKAIIKNEKGLSPRNSFKLWKEVVKCRSKEWLQPELTAAASFAHSLEKHLNLIHISEEEQKYRTLSALLQEANAELENLNWISTHDLQEPLRKIQIIASRIVDSEEKADTDHVTDKVNKISNAARRMQTLLKDILHYTRIRNAREELLPTDVAALIKDMMPDYEDQLSRTGGRIEIGALPEVRGNSFLLKQLFSNLVFNAIKFQKIGVPVVVSITAAPGPVVLDEAMPDNLFNVIYVDDNGIGFEQEYAASIFKVFTRLNDSIQYEGSGIGLALCKKIMLAHEGHITASGEPGVGASFQLYFPV